MKLDQCGANAQQMALEGVDVCEPLILGGSLCALSHLLVNTHDEHFFVVGTIEDADVAAGRQSLRRPPQKIVIIEQIEEIKP